MKIFNFLSNIPIAITGILVLCAVTLFAGCARRPADVLQAQFDKVEAQQKEQALAYANATITKYKMHQAGYSIITQTCINGVSYLLYEKTIIPEVNKDNPSQPVVCE